MTWINVIQNLFQQNYYFNVEVRDSEYVADFCIKITEMIDLSVSVRFAEYAGFLLVRRWNEKMKVVATVFAIVGKITESIGEKVEMK